MLDQSEKYKRIKFNKIGGCFKQLYGSFELQPYQGKTLLTYRMFVDPGIPIPKAISDGGLQKDLPDILEKLKQSAENS